jgi:hypothetical protein
MPATAADFAPVRFSTDDLPEREQLPRWREEFGRGLVRVDIEPLSSEGRRNHRGILFLIIAGTFAISGAMNSTFGQPQGLPAAGTPEMKSATPDPLVASTSRWDANHDGIFTCDEWKQYANRLFTLADKNADGFLDDKEFQQIGKIEPVFAGADMAYFDDNNDRRISRKEFAEKPSPLFARYDANRDCRVTAEEIKGSASPTPGKGSAPPGRGGAGGPGGRSGF